MSDTTSNPESDEATAQRRERLVAQLTAMGMDPRAAAAILAVPVAEDDDYPGDEEFVAYLNEIYAARDRDLAQQQDDALLRPYDPDEP